MNKTFIKLDTTPDDERAGPILKPMGAFRHTEYAKGFYKVGAANLTLDSLESSQGNDAAFSEIER